MFRNYLITAFRNFWKNKTITLINLFGLAVGLASVIMIFSYIRYNLSFDKYYSNSNRIFRLILEKDKGDITQRSIFVPEALSGVLISEFPEVEMGTPFWANGAMDFIFHEKAIILHVAEADSNFFEMFNLPFIFGDPATALKGKGNIVLTKSIAQKFFPGINPVGLMVKSKSFNGTLRLSKITGVIEDIPPNTHFSAEVILSGSKSQELDWQGYRSVPQYIMLKKHTDIRQLEDRMNYLYKKYDFPERLTIHFQPVTSIHLHSDIPDDQFENSDIAYIYIFSIIAFFILLIACINYINLLTARSLQRTREVGVRRVMGAERNQLMVQYIGESLLFFCIALPVALLIARICWPLFVDVVRIQADLQFLFSWKNIVIISLVSLLSGTLSGIYPAFFLSRMRPVYILKNSQKGLRINLGLRKTLIVLQFVISILLIISTIVVYKQLYMVDNMELGFNKNNLIVLPSVGLKGNMDAFKNELERNSNILGVTMATWNVGQDYGGSSSTDNPKDSSKELSFSFVDTDPDFKKTMQISLIQGRWFSSDYANDVLNSDSIFNAANKGRLTGEEFTNLLSRRSVILDEAAVNALGLKKPVGQVLKLGALKGTVIGVIKNFNGISLHQRNPLLVIRAGSTHYGFTYIRVNPQNTLDAVGHIRKTWKRFFPGRDFSFSFVDDRLQHLYDSERRLASLFSTFAGLAIIIACLGLLSMVALAAQQRTKEIGIRKVLGASINSIITLLVRDFVLLILIALIIASPIAWWAMNKWLEDFAYRIHIGWWIFAVAAILTTLIAMLTVSFQAIKAAMANPVKSLRTE